MKIKLNAITKDMENLGFNLNDVYDVQEIEVSGDFCAYDIFYKIQSKTGREDVVFDDLVNIIDDYTEFDDFMEVFNKYIYDKNINIPYKFKFNFPLI
jgi:hypothetical protein